MKRTIIFIIAAFVRLSFAGGIVNQFTLSNGIKVLHKETNNLPLVTIQIFLHSGTINEKEKQAGIASFTQGLLFQGTKRRTSEQISRGIEDIGGSISSDIEYDYSNLSISLLDSNFEKAVEILSDVTANPSFPKEEIEKERYNALAAIKSRNDHIFDFANDLFNSTFYGNHPYSWPDAGKAETISKFARKDLLNWHKKYFTANNMLIVVMGNVSLDKTKEIAEKYFSPIKKGKPIVMSAEPKLPPAKNVSRKNNKFQQAFLMIGFPAPDLKNPEYPVLKVINAMLGSRMSGRLFMELREKLSLAYEVSSFYPSREQLSRFVIYIGLEKKNIELARSKINEILKDLKNNPVDNKELEETKNFIRGIYLLDHQTINRKAWNIGWWEVMGRGFAYDEKYLQDLMSVEPAGLQKAAQTYFTDNFVQIEIVPE